MSGITADLLATQMRINLNNLKSFAEQLNAELSEDAQAVGNENRQSHRRDMSKILQEFGEAEAFFEKGKKCLEKVDREVKNSFPFDVRTILDDAMVFNEMKSICRSLEGAERTEDGLYEQDHDSESPDSFIMQQMRNVQDILVELGHPLKMDEQQNDDDDNAEEDRMVKELEAAQKRVFAKSRDDDEEFRVDNLYESNEAVLNITPNSFERVAGVRSENRDVRLEKVDQLQAEYKNELVRGSSVCPKQLYESKIGQEADVDFDSLPLLTKFKENILELFSNDAILVLEKKQTYTDPISKTAIQNPVRNKICDHIYERDTIYGLLRSRKTMACPCLGCSCRSFSANDLEEDEEAAARILHSQTRARATKELTHEDAETEDEADPDSDTLSQEIL